MADFEAVKKTSNSLKEFNVQIPITLAKRAEIYAQENNNTITNVVVQALDYFLREQRKNSSDY